MTSAPLKGMRLVVSGFELEQGEHRGIAVFTKNLLRTLKQLGAEVWLLTEYSPDTQAIKKAKRIEESYLGKKISCKSETCSTECGRSSGEDGADSPRETDHLPT